MEQRAETNNSEDRYIHSGIHSLDVRKRKWVSLYVEQERALGL